MNTKTLITIKTDKRLKQAAQETAKDIGIPLGTLLNSFMKQFVRNKEITLSSELVPSKYLMAIIESAEHEFAQGNLPTVKNTSDFISELKSL